MDGKINDKEFERFLKENADNHRLYPSEAIWNNIHNRLHTRKRWYVVGLSLLFLTAFTVTAVMLTDQGSSHKKLAATINTAAEKENAGKIEAIKPLPLPLQNNPAQKRKLASPDNQHDNYFIATHLYEENTASVAQELKTAATSLAMQEEEHALFAAVSHKPLEKVNPAAASAQLEIPAITPIQPPPAEENKLEESQEKLVNLQWMEEASPLTIESVTNSYERQKHSPRFRWQLHFTPTISYRSLKEDQKFIAQARMNLSNMPAAATPDLENVINHRPDLGMQFGISGTYPLGKRLDWITGIQFNASKYDIKAFNYPTEVATIALVNSWGGPTAVSTVTSFRSNGFMSRAKWLRNYYYSISIPLGLEWRVLGKKHNHWGISATVQPTYVVGNRSYIISMDYQNYAEVPYLIRKWNLNLAFETYAKFNLGKKDFRIGPQVRYQAFSSFKKGYPVQEHLYDFGVKLGMQLGK